jgi:hypothetical protein
LEACPILPEDVTARAVTQGHSCITSVKKASVFSLGRGTHCTQPFVVIEHKGSIPYLYACLEQCDRQTYISVLGHFIHHAVRSTGKLLVLHIILIHC